MFCPLRFSVWASAWHVCSVCYTRCLDMHKHVFSTKHRTRCHDKYMSSSRPDCCLWHLLGPSTELVLKVPVSSCDEVCYSAEQDVLRPHLPRPGVE
ncbi:hypothetical protein B0H21DRAFT_518077 [Amylocystis lapponica]|nr:hypothetical protein B0H21DRAFT_518077 [Amylocystis lapponica]